MQVNFQNQLKLMPCCSFLVSDGNKLSDLKDPVPEGSRDFTVEGQRKDMNTIYLKLRIADSTGCLFLFLEHVCLASLIMKRYVIPTSVLKVGQDF